MCWSLFLVLFHVVYFMPIFWIYHIEQQWNSYVILTSTSKNKIIMMATKPTIYSNTICESWMIMVDCSVKMKAKPNQVDWSVFSTMLIDMYIFLQRDCWLISSSRMRWLKGQKPLWMERGTCSCVGSCSWKMSKMDGWCFLLRVFLEASDLGWHWAHRWWWFITRKPSLWIHRFCWFEVVGIILHGVVVHQSLP